MTDHYMDQYKKETSQVHAPMDLIERTKAAVREEEERILRERTVQGKISETAVYVDEVKRAKGFAAHKWAYPLTAAAALLILVSVSMTMKGIKRSSSEMSGGCYEESADAGFVESETIESVTQENGFADLAAEAVEEEMAVESAADELPVEAAAGGVDDAGSVEEGAALSINETQRSMEEKKQAASVVKDMEQEIEDAEATKGDLKEKQEAAAESLNDSVAAADRVTIEKVTKKPAICDLPDIEEYVYEGKTFFIKKEENGWTAYVETESGAGYVLRADIEELEEFLKVGYGKLVDIR